MLPLVLALAVLVGIPLTARAAGNVDINRTDCSITVALRSAAHPGENIDGQVELHRVGECYVSNSALYYRMVAPFTGSGLTLDDLSAPGLAEGLAGYVSASGLEGTVTEANSDNQFVFSGLSTGVYLVMQKEVSEDYEIQPFLVSLPMYSHDSNSWLYQVEANPKVSDPREDVSLTVRKKWLDNSALKRPTSVTVQLLCDGEPVEGETVELSKENKWKYTWTNLSAYYKWSVKEVEVPEGYKVTYSQSGTTILITNTHKDYVPPKELIQTGQLNWPVPVLLSSGLCLLLLGVVLMNKRKKNNDAA